MTRPLLLAALASAASAVASPWPNQIVSLGRESIIDRPAIAIDPNGGPIAVLEDGTVAVWGDTGLGPVNVPQGLAGVRSVTSGTGFFAALKDDGTVVTWDNRSDPRRIFNDPPPVPGGLSHVREISSGGDHLVALYEDGRVTAWANSAAPGADSVPPGLAGVRYLAAGWGFTVAVLDNDSIVGWGERFPSFAVPGHLPGIRSLSANYHASAVMDDGSIRQWSMYPYGSGWLLPSDLPRVRSVDLGYDISLALLENGTLRAWGSPGKVSLPGTLEPVRALGGAGNALLVDGRIVSLTPVLWGTAIPIAMTDLVAIAGPYALGNDGSVKAWKISRPNIDSIPPALGRVRRIAFDPVNGGCTYALKEDGTVVRWGVCSELGRQLLSASGIRDLASTSGFVFAVDKDGSVRGFGGRSLPTGLEGVGSIYPPGMDAPPGLTGVKSIAIGGRHVVALREDGTVVAWGDSASGQTRVPAGLSGVVAIAAGETHSLALREDGSVVSWGSIDTVPSGLTEVVAIAIGPRQGGLALRKNGSVIEWNHGRLATVAASGIDAILDVDGLYLRRITTTEAVAPRPPRAGFWRFLPSGSKARIHLDAPATVRLLDPAGRVAEERRVSAGWTDVGSSLRPGLWIVAIEGAQSFRWVKAGN